MLAIYTGLEAGQELRVLKKIDIEAQAYRDAMARLPAPSTSSPRTGQAGKRGATVIAACSVSDAPPTILVCVNRQNPSNELFLENGRFALNTLAAEHEPLAVGFSGVTGLPPEERLRWASGTPSLRGRRRSSARSRCSTAN